MHRLFLGCPLPAEAADRIAAWSASELGGLRVIPAESLHVTLIFFGAVDEATRDELVSLTRKVVWNPLPVVTGALAALGRSAVGVSLSALWTLENRLVRASATAPPGLSPESDPEAWGAWRESVWDPDDPLYHIALKRPVPENERVRRRNRAGRPMSLHLTLARAKPTPHLLDRRMPSAEFALDRLTLYESHLDPEGSSYEILARAR